MGRLISSPSRKIFTPVPLNTLPIIKILWPCPLRLFTASSFFGGKVKITKKDGKTFVNGSEIVTSIETGNGIIHVINDVLLPK